MDSEDEFFDAPEAFSLGSHVTECYSKAANDTSSSAYRDESISRLWASFGSYPKTADHVDQDLGLFTRPSHAPTDLEVTASHPPLHIIRDGSADALQVNSLQSQPPSRARTFNSPSTHLHSSLDFTRTSATIATFHPSDVSLGTAQRTFLPGLTEQESYYNSLADTLYSVCATSSAVQRFQRVSSAPVVSDSLKLGPDPNLSVAHAKSWSLDTARLHLASGTSNDVWSRQIPSVPSVPEKLADFPNFPALPDPTLDQGCSP
ncbi:unnamed protein product [Dicrocoelium dendriticum]|nr:unnamed protein product [Dicrocoelium dendriticum]